MRVDRKSKKSQRGKAKRSYNRYTTDNESMETIILDTTDTSKEVVTSLSDTPQSITASPVKLGKDLKESRVNLVNLIFTDYLTVEQRHLLTEKNRQLKETLLNSTNRLLTKRKTKKEKIYKHDLTISSVESISDIVCQHQSTPKRPKKNPKYVVKKYQPKEKPKVRDKNSCGIRNSSVKKEKKDTSKESFSPKPRKKKRKRKIVEVVTSGVNATCLMNNHNVTKLKDEPISIHSSSTNSSCIVIEENKISISNNEKRLEEDLKKSDKSVSRKPKTVKKERKISELSQDSFETFLRAEGQRCDKKSTKSRKTGKKKETIFVAKTIKIESSEGTHAPLEDFTHLTNQSNFPAIDKQPACKLNDESSVSVNLANSLYEAIVPSTTEINTNGIDITGPRENDFSSHINGDLRSEDLGSLPTFSEALPVLDKKHSSLDSIARAIEIDREKGNRLSPPADCNLISTEIINLPVDTCSLPDIPDVDQEISLIPNHQEHSRCQNNDKPNEKCADSINGITSLHDTSVATSGSTISPDGRKRKLPEIIKDDLLPQGTYDISVTRSETPRSNKKLKNSIRANLSNSTSETSQQDVPINDVAIVAGVAIAYNAENLTSAFKNWSQAPEIAAILNYDNQTSNECPTVICEDAVNNNRQACSSNKNEPNDEKAKFKECPTVVDGTSTLNDEMNAMSHLLSGGIDQLIIPDDIAIPNARSKLVSNDNEQIDETASSYIIDRGNNELTNVDLLENVEINKIEELTIQNLDRFNSALSVKKSTNKLAQRHEVSIGDLSKGEEVNNGIVKSRKRKWFVANPNTDSTTPASNSKIKLVRKYGNQGGKKFIERCGKFDGSSTASHISESQTEESHPLSSETKNENVADNKDDRVNNSRDFVDSANINNFSKIGTSIEKVKTRDTDVHQVVPGFGESSIYNSPVSSSINENNDEESSGSSSSSTSSSYSDSSSSSSSGISTSESIPIESEHPAEPCCSGQIPNTRVTENKVLASVATKKLEDSVETEQFENLVTTEELELPVRKNELIISVPRLEFKVPVTTEEFETSMITEEFKDSGRTEKVKNLAETNDVEGQVEKREIEARRETEKIEVVVEKEENEIAVKKDEIVARTEKERIESPDADELEVLYDPDDLEDLCDAETMAGTSSITGSLMEKDKDTDDGGNGVEDDGISLFAESLNASRCGSPLPREPSKFPDRRSPIAEEPYQKMKSDNMGAFVSANNRECEATLNTYKNNVRKPEIIFELCSTSEASPLLPNTTEFSNAINNSTGTKIDLRSTLTNRMQTRDMELLFSGHCFAWLKNGNCNMSSTCRYRHTLKHKLQEIQQYDGKNLEEILAYAISKRYSYFFEIVQKKAMISMTTVQIIAMYTKLYRAKLLTITHLDNTIELLKEHGLSMKEIFPSIEAILASNDVMAHMAVMNAFHRKLESGTCWEILGKMMSIVMPPVPIIETVLAESIEKKCLIHANDVNVNMISRIPACRRPEINESLLRQFEDMLKRSESPSTNITTVQPQIRPIEVHDWNCGIISPESPRPDELPSDRELPVEKTVLTTTTHNAYQMKQVSSGKSTGSHRISPSLASTSADNSYILLRIDKVPPPKSPYRDKMWKFHWDLQGVQEGLKHKDYFHVIEILSQYARYPNRLPHIDGFYKILCNEIMSSNHHIAEIVRLTVQSGSSDALRQYVYDLGIYVLTKLADIGSWLLAYELLKTLHVYGTYNTCAFTLLAAEIYIANQRPLKALALLKRSRIVFANSRIWNQMQCPEDEVLRVSVMDLLLYSLCDNCPDQALALLEFIVADQCSNFKPINVGRHVERITRRLLMERCTNSILDMGRLIIKAHLLVSTTIFRALINHVFHDDRLLAKQLHQYATWLGTYNRAKINGASCAHMIVNTDWTEEETHLMISSLIEDLYTNIGHAIDRLKTRQLNVFLIFESIPTERQLITDLSGEISKAAVLNKRRVTVKNVLDRFDPRIKLIQKSQGRVCKLQSESLVNYLKSGQLKH